MCFFFKQKTAYEMRISDWSSDVCSSDLRRCRRRRRRGTAIFIRRRLEDQLAQVRVRRGWRGNEFGAAAARQGFHVADADGQRAARNRRSKRDEVTALNIADNLRRATLHPEKVGGARLVDIVEGATHTDVRRSGSYTTGSASCRVRVCLYMSISVV